ncbi:MAG: hypothetical protein JNK87_15530 [Bryobacterales bacterium]|nr:hypothetical protein [Bryobacterales bacterium]
MAEVLTEDLQAKPLSGPQVRQYFQAPPHQWQQLQAMQGQVSQGRYMTLPPVNRSEYMTLPPPKITVEYVTQPPLRGPNGK